eukprot:CAMPEP_0172477826 /NCGR_PEP_ID=MMETSP1066-20121228/1307_1 /TAXON_ID=671091 /ORGANISM="Coscinodiscus wailesii, Strain CCMP2513" /LENGTH=750 /DNA_ID=CAMNT_0013236761 /DNA_START=107 /DNA_END=2359 /DNA_ORIENTATION=+
MKFTTAASILLPLITTSTAFTPAAFISKSNNLKCFEKNSGCLATSDLSSDVKRSWSLSMSTETEAEAATTESETYEFQAEVGRVMDIIINSLYSDRDVFLRELVSNAADACDKKRFLSITADSSESAAAEPEIKIKSDKTNQKLIIEDSGVGMTRQELINNLGNIAQSGTKKFLEALGENKQNINLIGQFGVGFYSSFLVADKVRVVTKSMTDGKVYSWESDATGGSYTISEVEDDPFESNSGTRLEMTLKEDAFEYMEADKLGNLLTKYSEFIEFPISLWKEKTEYESVPDVEANKELKEGEEAKMKTVPKTVEGFELMNTQKPIWLRSPKDVTEEEYKEFYKTAFKMGYDEKMAHTHFSLEGSVECKALLYVPGMLPFELSKDMFDENASNLRLYVKRVFINDKFDEMIPRWLKFIKGVVDSDDLPLNVGREILQKSKVLNIIRKRLIKKSLDMINEITKDEDESKYIMFWNNFGKYLKVGVVEDDLHRFEIAPLLRFFSSSSEEEYRSLEDYEGDMKEGQKSIYYITADSKAKASKSPILEKVTSKGYEVLYMVEPLDEICVQSLARFRDYDLVDITKEGLDIGEDEEKEESKKTVEKLNEEFKPVLEYMETLLGGKIKKATMTTLLKSSPAALVQGEYGMSPSMQKYMKAQSVALGDSSMPMGNMNQAVLELNPENPIVKDLQRMVEMEQNEKENFGMLIYDVAAMTSGYEIEDTGDFATRVMKLMNSEAVADEADDEVKDAEIVE